jgi:hypothetical protein
MDVEVVAAGVAAEELGRGGYGGGDEDDGGTGETVPMDLRLAGRVRCGTGKDHNVLLYEYPTWGVMRS